MTDLVPCYETSGPLTLCPCCGGDRFIKPSWRACEVCVGGRYGAFSQRVNDASARSGSVFSDAWYSAGRAEWARIGLELRASGRLPPLTCRTRELEPERWGVWLESSDEEAPGWCVPWGGVTDEPFLGNESQARQYCSELSVRFRDSRYAVKPYPGTAEQTSDGTEAPAGGYHAYHPEALGPGVDTRSRSETPRSAPASPGQAGGESSDRADPYTAKRLADERRREELTAKIESNAKTIGLLKTELDGWQHELELLG